MTYTDIFCHQNQEITSITVNLTKNSEYRDRTLVHFERIPENVTHPAGLTGLQNDLLIFFETQINHLLFQQAIFRTDWASLVGSLVLNRSKSSFKNKQSQ